MTGVPAPAVYLLAAACAATAFGSLGDLSVETNQLIVTIALAVILFDGGLHIGRRRLQPVLAAVTWVGTAGTLVTAAALAVAAHGLFDFSWRAALALGTALAPTDPAVVFAVLGPRTIVGRTGTLLEGESGANDPVGIALMVSVLAASSGSFGAVAGGVGTFALQLVLGVAFGLTAGWLTTKLPVAGGVTPALLAAGAFGGAAVSHGSGFLAVFVAGIFVGDVIPVRGAYSWLSSVGEVVAFVVLGLSVTLRSVGHQVGTGLLLAALLILVVRPVLVGLVLWPVRLSRGERGFVLWSGLKGAVPILLGTYVLDKGIAGASRVYDVIFVVVLVSVVVQGSLVPFVARRLGVEMR